MAKRAKRRAKPKVPREWIRTASDRLAVKEGCWFDPEAAERVRTFFRKFTCHSKGQWAGQPFELLQWQWEDIIAPMFGWKRPDGTRRFRQAYIEIPKKNGKTTLLAGLALYLLTSDGPEQGAEIYIAAADRDQAGLMWGEAEAMVKASAALRKWSMTAPSRKRIAFPSTGSFLTAVSADAYTSEGVNAHAVLFDELHAQRDRRLWDTFRFAGAARRQPLLIAITTAGWDRESICYEQHDYAAKVLEGTIEDTAFLPVIYGAGKDEDWTDPKVWRRANPSLGTTITEADMAAACKEAQESPRKENAFRRYRLNQWTEQAERWLPMDAWRASGRKVDPAALAGRPCWAGLDLANTTDIAALVLAFEDDDGPVLLPWFWVPEESAERRERRDRVPYRTWARQGFIEMTPGPVTDYRYIRKRIVELGKEYAIQQIGYDPYNATHIVTELGEEDGFNVIQFRQGYLSMNAPSKELERLVISGRLGHPNHPVLTWMASNVTTKTDPAGSIKPDKDRSTEKIDGIVAAIMALGLMMVREGTRRSVYEDRGPLVIG